MTGILRRLTQHDRAANTFLTADARTTANQTEIGRLDSSWPKKTFVGDLVVIAEQSEVDQAETK